MSPELSDLIRTLPVWDASAVAVDFETYYDKDCSVKKLGNWAYTQHKDFDVLLISIWAPDVQFVGHPKDVPEEVWGKIAERRWLSHNRNFDAHVFQWCVSKGIIPDEVAGPQGMCDVLPELTWVGKELVYDWQDTADLAVWSHLPRSLAQAAAYGLGTRMEKKVRADMEGKRIADLSPEEYKAFCDYALDDGPPCWALWQKYGQQWPVHERLLSLHTGNIEFRGIPVNWELVDQGIHVLNTAKWKIEKKVPWINDNDEKGKKYKLGSPRAIARECAKFGVPIPESTSIKSEAFQEWLEEYGDVVPSLRELSRYRRTNNVLKRLETLKTRRRPDGRAALSLKYGGAEKTMRWSGTAGFSLHNMQRAPLFFDAECEWLSNSKGAVYSVDIRKCLVASPGNMLAIADLAQIEPRTLNWIVANKTFLDLCAQGMSPYEAHARASMGWTGGKLKKENPQLYALAKARLLALGYGAGWAKFIYMAKTYIVDKDGIFDEPAFDEIFAVPVTAEQTERFLSFLEFCEKKQEIALFNEELSEKERNIWVNAWLQVMDFRTSNPLLAGKENPKTGAKDGLWQFFDKSFKASLKDGTYENELPSGRSLMYYDISSRGWFAKQGSPAGRPVRVYGGLLTENFVQACARDVFSLGILRLEAAGYKVLFHVHDEYIIDMPPTGSLEEILSLIRQVPDWAKSLPVDAEAELSPFYKK